jgi:hypothetical protein
VTSQDLLKELSGEHLANDAIGRRRSLFGEVGKRMRGWLRQLDVARFKASPFEELRAFSLFLELATVEDDVDYEKLLAACNSGPGAKLIARLESDVELCKAVEVSAGVHATREEFQS